MARAGDTIESPVSGARIVFRKTAHDTNGELLQYDEFLKVGGRGPREHVHPYQEERFEIVSGTARIGVRGQERDYGAGETVLAPAGVRHVWWNPGEEEVHLIIEFRPALRVETFLETFFGLHKDGKVNPKSGLPNPFQRAVISHEYEDEVYLAWPPLFVQRVFSGLLAPIGKLLGYEARYPEYSGPEAPLARRREGEGPSAAYGAMRWRIAVGAVVAVVGLLSLRRRVRSGRR
jgi:quercetin dioxygenase-like cupin family protein